MSNQIEFRPVKAVQAYMTSDTRLFATKQAALEQQEKLDIIEHISTILYDACDDLEYHGGSDIRDYTEQYANLIRYKQDELLEVLTYLATKNKK